MRGVGDKVVSKLTCKTTLSVCGTEKRRAFIILYQFYCANLHIGKPEVRILLDELSPMEFVAKTENEIV